MLIAHAQKRVCVYSDKIIVNRLGTFKRRLRTSHNWNKSQNGDITLAAHRREAQCVPNIIFFDVCCLRCDVERCFKLAPPAVRADQTGRQRRDVLNVSRPFVLCYRTCERDIFWKQNKPILMRARRICGTAQTCAALITTAGPLSNAIKRPVLKVNVTWGRRSICWRRHCRALNSGQVGCLFTLILVFTARCYAVTRCLSVCPSRSWVAPKRIKISHFISELMQDRAIVTMEGE